MLKFLQMGGAVLTLLTGLYSLFLPRKVFGFTGLVASGGRGITEIRSVLGGVFVALGAAALYFDNPLAYKMVGIVYLVIGGVRAISMVVDRSIDSSNIISLVFELVFGVILIL